MAEPGAQIRVEKVARELRISRARALPAGGDISFDVQKGEFVTLVGPSGCGKSTMLKLIAGLIRPTRGRILADGYQVDVRKPPIGMVFQKPVLLEWRNVLRNVLFTIEVLGRDARQYSEKARQLLRLVGLDGFEERFIWELSGGMQQRVSICRALIHDPPILPMDE